jgi:hypothetical protein
VSIFDTIERVESGGQNIVTRIQPPGGGNTASGYYQIINSTWQQYARQAGVDTNLYPTAMSAPKDVQTQVASQIPLRAWVNFAPTTAAAVQRDFGALDPNMTLGQINAQHGGGTLAGQGVNTGGLTTPVSTGVNPASIDPELGPGGALGAGGVTVQPDPASEATLAIGLQPMLAKGITDTVNKAVETVTAPIKAAFASLANWFTRGALIVVGVVIMALALWSILAPQGYKPGDVASAAMQSAAKV